MISLENETNRKGMTLVEKPKLTEVSFQLRRPMSS